MNRIFSRTLAFVFVFAIMALLPLPVSATLTVEANHSTIDVDYNYHGNQVSVKGTSDSGVDIIIKVNSEDKEQKLMRKDKRAGFIWMNVEALHFSGVPDVYLLKSSRPLGEMIDKEQELSHVVGYEALEAKAEIEPDKGAEQNATWFEQFLRFKEARHLFMQSSGDIELSAAGDAQQYSTVLAWPFEAPPGQYNLEVMAVKDGKVVETANTSIKVEQVGAVRMLAGMAMDKAAIYGALSIIIALAAGFGVGAVFGKGGGAH